MLQVHENKELINEYNLAGNLNSGLSYLITAVQRFLRMETLSDPDNRQKLTKHYTYLLT